MVEWDCCLWGHLKSCLMNLRRGGSNFGNMPLNGSFLCQCLTLKCTNRQPSPTGSCSKGTSSKHPQTARGHLCFSLIQRLFCCAASESQTDAGYLFLILFILVRYKTQNVSAQNWALPDSVVGAKATAEYPALVVSAVGGQGLSARTACWVLFKHCRKSELCKACNWAMQQPKTFNRPNFFGSFFLWKTGVKSGSEQWRLWVPSLHKKIKDKKKAGIIIRAQATTLQEMMGRVKAKPRAAWFVFAVLEQVDEQMNSGTGVLLQGDQNWEGKGFRWGRQDIEMISCVMGRMLTGFLEDLHSGCSDTCVEGDTRTSHSSWFKGDLVRF